MIGGQYEVQMVDDMILGIAWLGDRERQWLLKSDGECVIEDVVGHGARGGLMTFNLPQRGQ